MPNKFHIDSFDPAKLKKANLSLDKHLKAVLVYEQFNKTYQERLSKKSFWRKVLRFFQRS
jgi:hypothetical protein